METVVWLVAGAGIGLFVMNVAVYFLKRSQRNKLPIEDNAKIIFVNDMAYWKDHGHFIVAPVDSNRNPIWEKASAIDFFAVPSDQLDMLMEINEALL